MSYLGVPKTTIRQYEEIIAFLEGKNRIMLFEKSSANEKLWVELQQKLNRIGPIKTSEQWKKVQYIITFSSFNSNIFR